MIRRSSFWTKTIKKEVDFTDREFIYKSDSGPDENDGYNTKCKQALTCT